MPNPTKRTLQVLLIADPGQPSRRVASIRDRFEDELQMTFDAEAHVDTCTKMIRIQSDQSLELGSLDTLVSDDYPDVDVVLMLTGIPRHTRGKPLVAEIQPGRDYAVVSYPTLGAWTTKSRLLVDPAQLRQPAAALWADRCCTSLPAQMGTMVRR